MAQSHTIFFKDKNHCAVMFLAVAALHGQAVNAAPIQFAGQNSELVISEVSERTAGIELLPLDEQGHPRQAAPSTILASFPMIEKFRARELNGEKGIRAGKLQVIVTPEPLTISVRRPDGKLVQELTFEEDTNTNSAVKFRTTGPVLGLGEGANQFERRGAFYPMTTVRIHPGANGTFTLYDGDGQSLGYRDGSDAKIIWIRFGWNDAARRLTLEPDARMKQWPGGIREFALEFAGQNGTSKRISFKGERIEVKL